MPVQRYCPPCAQDVNCREARTEHAVALYCPQCDRRIATNYGDVKLAR